MVTVLCAGLFATGCTSTEPGYFSNTNSANQSSDVNNQSAERLIAGRLIAGQSVIIGSQQFIVKRAYHSALQQTCVMLSSIDNQRHISRACFSQSQQKWMLMPQLIING